MGHAARKNDQTNGAPATIAPSLQRQGFLREEDVPVVREFLTEAQAYLETAEADVLKLEENPRQSDSLDSIFRAFHTIKGVAGFLDLTQIGALAHATENLMAAVREAKPVLNQIGVGLVFESIDLMKALFAALADAVKHSAAIAEDPRVDPLLTRLNDWVTDRSESPEVDESQTHSAETMKDSTTPLPPVAIAPPASTPSPAAASARTTLRVSTERLDNLIDMVGELVVAQAMVTQDLAPVLAGNARLNHNFTHLSKIARQLQELSLSMRMVSVRGTFQKIARLVRDLSTKSAKQVELVMTGEETEIDRNLVEAIEDPLMHMVRNAIDHGIEPAEQRLRVGKPAAGRIELHACHEAGNVVIRIGDDGRGLNQQRILERAVASELVTADEKLNESEVCALIFHAGLSTADAVTSISGRGVGMDVVRRNIEAVRGRIGIESEAGRGCRFTLRLPLTLALIDGLLVRVGSEIYIIPLANIEQSIQLKAHQLSTIQGRAEMCMVRNSLLRLFRLHELFAIQGATRDPLQGVTVIVQDGQRRCGVLVDELVGQQQVVIKPLGHGATGAAGILGGAIVGNGNVSLILDVPGLLDAAGRAARPGEQS